ncbi:2-hydroxy-3-keto-5-methylthiopentenyl-1-phosphatephosphatase [Pigmentiphaga humi]|uniref:2-hydroxy-3-keto-5-methylthiopentenyl-1-phosphate phosphatase n=1 Tax=Pigmentiphaga humi TaxID=2478468 RepID=A0A3P4B160_9BURK|nr:MtnX-like HAD-IB family phosphatase [Pigmentiphaga humi]VCU69306.1 2-hydroxy-3-keto-5-methylthiopentenyl-1-phosphatephosphatase [Pigmentiphaga humi]
MLIDLHSAKGLAESEWIVLCDFDGTISTRDVTDTLLDRFGKPGWQALEEAWERGEIGSRTCMAEQIALIDASKEELEELVDSIEIDPAFPDFVRQARALGVPVHVVSDGLAAVITRVLGRHGLADLPVVANRIKQVGPRSWKLDFPYADAACSKASGTCKCSYGADVRQSRSRILYVGDGASDFCVAGTVDFVLAKHRLIDYCRDHGLVHIPIAGFSEARNALEFILGGQLHAIAQPPREFGVPPAAAGRA